MSIDLPSREDPIDKSIPTRSTVQRVGGLSSGTAFVRFRMWPRSLPGAQPMALRAVNIGGPIKHNPPTLSACWSPSSLILEIIDYAF